MDPSQQFKALQESVQAALVTATRTVNGLANEDLQFQRTAHPSVGNHLDEKTQRILDLANNLLKSAGEVTGQKVSALEDTDDVDIQWRGIVDNIDGLLEKADTSLDDYTGLIKRKDAPTPDIGRDMKRPRSTTEPLDWSLKRANILKPQEAFEKKPDNFRTTPWKPLLTQKPHAKVPLEKSVTPVTDQEMNTQFRHPYQTEILDMEYPQAIYEKRDPLKYLPLESTEAIWVDTYEGVLEMLEELKNATEIALDLEHHDYRTYAGLLSLMQISTREKDWVVDTLVPWRHKLEILNEVFADPKIVKVLHGAQMDIIWLQRDLGLYVVGLFDTYHAVDVLGTYPSKSLGALLKHFVNFDADKRYQLADWRIRPLDEKMMHYARCDTHFLLYVYDMLRNELVEKSDRRDPELNFIERVLEKSKETALQHYNNPYFHPEQGWGKGGWFNPLTKSNAAYDGQQFAVYKALYKWRDDLARLKDESTMYIMSPAVVADLAQYMPTDKKALWALLGNHARNLKGHLDELFDVIQSARASGLTGPTALQFLREARALNEGLIESQATPVVEADAAIPDASELRSTRSQFWGDMPMSTIWEKSAKPVRSDEKEVIVFTYPQPLHAQFGSAPPQEQRVAESPSGDRQAANEPETLVDQEFTLKTGRKPKVDHEELDSASDAEDMDVDEEAEPTPDPSRPQSADAAEFVPVEDADGSLDSDESGEEASETRSMRKKERSKAKKREKKEAKKQARAEKEAAKKSKQGEDEADDDEEPFDYSKAASVLHASKPNGGGRDSRGKKPFNPYSKKSGDAPKGARKLGHVKAGKTATFKK